ncbi:uncharacterized protein LOC119867461 [Canis lupus familiaris]|uniref:uncharacterized protein LOC119867461 n=1 Tax=Canis lupus familiaris TaxID=9615 RepID=UPI0018F77351|nr:uncharacterized protein LOC119867461 [Canis lupus familiaris]
MKIHEADPPMTLTEKYLKVPAMALVYFHVQVDQTGLKAHSGRTYRSSRSYSKLLGWRRIIHYKEWTSCTVKHTMGWDCQLLCCREAHPFVGTVLFPSWMLKKYDLMINLPIISRCLASPPVASSALAREGKGTLGWKAEFLQKKKSKEGVVEESRATHTDRCHWGWAGPEGSTGLHTIYASSHTPRAENRQRWQGLKYLLSGSSPKKRALSPEL